jgi:hypothetical protein
MRVDNCYGSIRVANGDVEKFEVNYDQMFEIHGYLPPHQFTSRNGLVFAAQHFGKVKLDAGIPAELDGGHTVADESTESSRIRNEIELSRLFSDPNLEHMRWSKKMPTSPLGVTYQQVHDSFGHPSPAIMRQLPATYSFTPHSDNQHYKVGDTISFPNGYFNVASRTWATPAQ